MKESGATLGSCTVSIVGEAAAEDAILICTPANVPNDTSWPGGDYTVKIEVSSGDTDTQFNAIYIERVSSDGTTVQETIASETGLTETFSAGTHTFGPYSGGAQTAAATDRLRVRIVLYSAAMHGSSGGTWDQGEVINEVITPLDSALAAIVLAPSSYIAASGADTTAQLTAPSGKTTADFDAGRIQDDENPADSVTISEDDYTELEWCMRFSDNALDNQQYEFRITKNGTPLDTYTVTPKATTASVAPPTGPPVGGLALLGVGR
jgi:hypothetical protein